MDPLEALARAGHRAVLSHESAARLHGIELIEPGQNTLTVPRSRSRLDVSGWRVRRADLPAGDVEEVDGASVTSVQRTLLDLARRLPVDEATVAADSALRQGLLTTSDLSRLARATGRGAARARAVASGADPSAESVLESLLRVALVAAGLRPLTQHVIRDAAGGFVARVDFCWPASRLVVEADGYAFHADRAAYRRDRERLNHLERLGWRVLRFTWEDVRHRPEHVVALVVGCLGSVAA